MATYSYNPSGTRAGKALENGIVTTYQYDAAHQLPSLSHNLGSTPVQTRAYQYNIVGNRTAMQVDDNAWDVYDFDAVDQITSVKYQSSNSGGVSPQRTVSYSWDPVGNRTQVQSIPATGSITTDVYATANAVNQYPAINGSSVTHDTNGNLTSTHAWKTGSIPVSLSYDSNNRLLSVTHNTDTVTTTYDTRNRVTSRTINGTTTLMVWDGWNLIEERNLLGDQIRRYVHGAAVDEILMMVDATGAKYHHHDALGSVTALTDSSGTLIESYTYDVFGKVTVTDSTLTTHPSSLAGNRFLYTGREWIAEAGLYDYRNRVYSPVIGRFMQTDPILFNAWDVNLYRYVGNGVVMRTDPSGLRDFFIGAFGTAIAGGGSTISAGIVFDSDTWMDSGIYVSGGAGVGFDISAGIGGGAVTELEGGGGALTVGLGPVSASVLTSTNTIGDYGSEWNDILDDIMERGNSDETIPTHGGGAARARVGAPVAATLTDTQTCTLSPNSVMDGLQNFWNWLTQ